MEFVSGAEISCLLWEGTVLSDRWQGHHSVHLYILRVYLPLGKGLHYVPCESSALSSQLGPVSWSKEQRSVGLGVSPLVPLSSKSS